MTTYRSGSITRRTYGRLTGCRRSLPRSRRAQPSIDSHSVDSLTSELVLAQLRPGLEALDFEVEAGSSAIRRSSAGAVRRAEARGVAYEVDAVNNGSATDQARACLIE